MPNISKINALAIGSVGKVDGLATSSILDINGVTVDPGINPTAPTSGFLFTYSGAAVAYSVRQLNNNADQIMRVRRASDNVEADVGFDAGELKLTSPISNTSDALSYTDFADFVDHTGTATNAFVRFWYDQTGLQFHASQQIATAQPKIYDSSTGFIVVESGGKPGILCADLGDYLEVTGAVDTTARTIYQWSVHSIAGTGSYPAVKTQQLQDLYYISTEIPRTFSLRTSSRGANAASAININQAYLRHSYADTTNVRTYLDGSSTAIIDISDGNEDWASADFEIFNSATGSTGRMTLSELVFFQESKSADVTAINNNINGHFGIY